jgi:phosphoglycerol transferase MdoB-like AlkP superfamily enzyme
MQRLYYIIIPYFITFLVTEALVRISIASIEWQHFANGVFSLLGCLVVGLIPDIAAFMYILPILLIFQFCIPNKIVGTKQELKVQSVLYAVFFFLIISLSIAQYLFWDELSSRFNFIAVDYLIYMDEVLGNIWETYNIVPMVLGAITISAITGRIYFAKIGALRRNKINLKQKFGAFVLTLVLAIGSFLTVSSDTAEVLANDFENELARNGLFSLFSAFRNNELSYEKFYITDEEKSLSDLRRLLNSDNKEFIDSGITRRITSANKEIRPNIVLITVESLSAEYMRAFGNDGNLTPNLDKLAKESLFFKNIYATGTRTVYGLSAITLSIPPIPGNSIVRRINNDKLFSLGSVLNKKGYESVFFYGGFGYFDNMNTFFGGNGYRIVDRSNLSDEEITFANIWGVCDEDIFKRVLKENDLAYSKNQPFFDMIMTTSNHQPFTFPEGKIDIPSGKGRLGGIKYSDYAIGEFLMAAREKPWFDNTIFVIVADHTAGSSGKIDLDPKKHHIPMMFYAPKLIQPKEVVTLASQIDLAPTLLGLMNASYDSRFYGNDLNKVGAENRAFIANYQSVGLLMKDSLTILKPKRNAVIYKIIDGELQHHATNDNNLISDAVAYFQNASKWQKFSKDIN